jgi:uncharacterized membrane protein
MSCLRNSDGSLSLTRLTLLGVNIVAALLLAAHALLRIYKDIELLSWYVIGLLLIGYVFAMIDRYDARHISFKVSKTGVEAEISKRGG